MSYTLRPCPFCGSTNLRYDFCGSQGYIECNECCAYGPSDDRAADPICDDEAAFNIWNRRADDVLEIPGHGRVSREEASELLAMMLNGMGILSARMNSEHEWRIPGPALGRLVGRTALAAMLNALPANRPMIHALPLPGVEVEA